MAYQRESFHVEIKDMRGRGPQVVCTEFLPKPGTSCRAKDFIAARVQLGEEVMGWMEHRFDGCPRHREVAGVPSPGVEIFLVRRHRVTVEREGRFLSVPAGSYVVRNAGDVQEVRLTKKQPCEFHVLLLAQSWWVQFLREEAGLSAERASRVRFQPDVRKASPALKAALHLVGEGFHEGVKSGSSLLVDTAALQAAFHLLKEHPHAGANTDTEVSLGRQRDARLRHALEYVQKNFIHPIGLGEIGSASALSRSHLVRLFRKELGMSPHQYLIQVRVKRALALLQQQPHWPLQRVSEDVGIPSARHLSRLLARATGKNVSQIRSGHREGR